MKKAMFAAAIAVGVLVILSVAFPILKALLFEMPMPDSVGIIGGADGPTAMMLVGTIGRNVMIALIIGILFLAIGIYGFGRIKKRH